MSNFRFTEFSPTPEPVLAEKDTSEELAKELKAAREDAYRAGYVDGQAAATEAHLADQSRVTSELVEAIYDAGMTNEAARMHVVASIAPMIEQVALAIAPSIAEAGFLGEIVRITCEALESAPEARPRIRCAEELAIPLRALVAARHITAEIEEAPELLPREAQIFWEQGYDHIDLDACIASIREVISSHFSLAHGNEEHERSGYA
jgi:hypothetical protein